MKETRSSYEKKSEFQLLKLLFDGDLFEGIHGTVPFMVAQVKKVSIRSDHRTRGERDMQLEVPGKS